MKHGPSVQQRWREFAGQYIIDFNPRKAYERCNCYSASGASARAAALKLLSNETVQQFISEVIEERKNRMELDQDKVVQEQMCLAFSDIRNYVSWDNEEVIVFDSSHLTEEQSRAIKKVEIHEDPTLYGNRRTVKVELYPKQAAIESLFRHLGLYEKDNTLVIEDKSKDQIEDIKELLKAQRERLEGSLNGNRQSS